MRKISFNGLFEALSEKEMRNVIGGTPYGATEGGLYGNCYPTGPNKCGGTCYYNGDNGIAFGSTIRQGTCKVNPYFPTTPVPTCLCG